MALCEPSSRSNLGKLLRMQRFNQGLALAKDGGFSYKVEGCRMSGDMNTALGNCVLMCSMTVNLIEKLALRSFDFINNGDDLVLFVEREDLDRVLSAIPQHYLDFGFTMKVEEPVGVLEQVEFCQMRPVITRLGYMMTRQWDVALSKDLVTILDIPNERRFKQWMTAIGKGGLSVAPGMPILQEFYRKLDFGVSVGKITSHGAFDHASQWWGSGLTAHVAPILPETRVSFGLAFGLSEREQLTIEAHIRDWEPDYSTVWL